jgi:HNH endonuclease/AP2 domain
MLANFTAEWLRERVAYDPETGILTRLIKTRISPVGSQLGVKSGYGRMVACLNVNGKSYTYKVHRLAWLHYYGEWPSADVDHKDGDPSNNRISNLRIATDSQNLGNMKKPITNKSGKKGVSWHAVGKKWQAHVKINGVNKYLGLFATIDEAHSAYCQAATEGRGEFARFS